MLRVSAIVLCLFLSSKILAQSCPALIYPSNGSSNIPVNATISWNNVDGVTGYIISIGTVPGGNDIIQSQTSNSYFIPPLGLPDNTQIYITITLFFFNLTNIQCPSQSFKTKDIIIAPACTFLLSPKDGATNVNVGANISWAYVTGADGYFLSIGTSPGIGNIINNLDVGNTLQFNPLIDFMPLSSVNYSGGIIITDWYSNEQSQNESIKITIRFLTNEIRSDALSIKVFSRSCKTQYDCII